MATARRDRRSDFLPVDTDDVDTDAFPDSHHLVITTSKHVYSWDANRVSDIFQSGSGGILAAKKAKDGSAMLAVADSQIVVLHNLKKQVDKSYRLKGAKVTIPTTNNARMR